jgi:hypothetical protein
MRAALVALILLGTALAGSLTAHAQKRVALVVGNTAYRHTPRLPNPKNDATDVAAVLRKLGFQVLEGFDLDKAAFDRKVRDFAAALQGADAGLFFFAGHGMQVAGQNYLVPVDAELKTPSAVDLEMVRADIVQRAMEHEARTSLLFLDACRDNPLIRNLTRALGSTRSGEVGRGFAPMQSGGGTLISFSTQPGNVALDGTGRNSPYARALVRRLAAPKDDLSAILIDVRNDVMSATGDRQVPWEHSALRGRFYFASADPGSRPPPPLASGEPPKVEGKGDEYTYVPRLLKTVQAHAAGIGAIVMVGEDAFITVSADGTIKRWDLYAGHEVRSASIGRCEHRRAISDRLGGILLFGCPDGVLSRMDTDGLKPASARKLHSGGIYAAAVSPDGMLTLTAGEDGWIRLWRGKDWEKVHQFPPKKGDPSAVAFSPDGARMLAYWASTAVEVWRVDPLALESTIPAGRPFYDSSPVLFSRDGKSLVVGGLQQIMLFSSSTGKKTRSLNTEGYATELAMTPNGEAIFAGWSVAAKNRFAVIGGEQLNTIDVVNYDAESFVTAIAASHDGRRAVTGYDKGAIRIWRSVY